MNKKVLVVIVIVVAAVAVPLGIYTISPLFLNNTVNEPLPANVAANQSAAAASQEYQKFIVMNQQDRLNAANHMSTKEKVLIMIGVAHINNSIDENIRQ